MKHLGIIGAGAISSELLAALCRELPAPLEQISILVRPGRMDAAFGSVSEFQGPVAQTLRVFEEIGEFTAARPDLVIEAAGHGAVKDYVAGLLQNGIETVIASTGALADAALYDELEAAAIGSNSQLILPAGAVGAIDILAGLKYCNIESVIYTSRKPPMAWKGTRAENILNLSTINQETPFFDGSARQAAVDYPKNANVAATIALAGLGFDRTSVQLIADPAVSANIHVFDVKSDAAEISVRIEGKPSAINPKTSLPTVYSLLREVMRRVLPIVS